MAKDAEKEQRIKDAAERALAEAKERRANEVRKRRPVELGGREGPDPTRYGDWEKKGVAIDFS